MKSLFSSPLHRTLLTLIVITAAAFGMRKEGFAVPGVGVATLAIVWIKGRLIVLDFMELRHAPRLWRWLAQGWLMLVTTLILLFYVLGRSGTRF